MNRRIFFSLLGGAATSLAANPTPIRLLMLGDSQAKIPAGGKPLADLMKDRLAARAYQAEVINRGVAGQTSTMGLATLGKELAAAKPDLVALQFGVADAGLDPKVRSKPLVTPAKFKSNLRQMVKQVEKARNVPMLFTPVRPVSGPQPTEADKKLDERLQPYVQAVREVVREDGVILIDVYRAFERSTLQGPLTNGTALLAKGQEEIAMRIAERILVMRM